MVKTPHTSRQRSKNRIKVGAQHARIRSHRYNGGVRASFMNIASPLWDIDDLTEEQAEAAYGTGENQLGLSLLRLRVPFDPNEFLHESAHRR